MILRKMTKYIHVFIGVITLALAALPAGAFTPEFYAPSSAMSSGKWMKISVDESGLYQIPTATLRSWGFSDPEKVRIHGYGGRRIADVLNEANYVDDLPETPSVVTSGGIAFYAAGPEDWVVSTGTYYHGYLNPYSSVGYYFVTESDSARAEIPETAVPVASRPQTTAQGRVHHEIETTQATSAGPLFVGENFSTQRSRSFSVSTPGRVDGSDVWMECSFFHIHAGATAMLTFSVDGQTIPAVSADKVPATSDSHYAHGSITTTRHTFNPDASDKFSLGIVYTPAISSARAYLDYLSFCYTRDLEMPSEGHMLFWSNNMQLSFAGDENTIIWDVTNPNKVSRVRTSLRNGRMEWSADQTGVRNYAAWNPGCELPAPRYVGTVSSQNLHGEARPYDMIIISPAELTAQANRIANLHATDDGMEVQVVDPEKIYNEFSSGACDVGGIRKYLKFIYDISADTERPLKYVLLLGRATLDQRQLTNTLHFTYRTSPWWVVREARLSMTDNDGYGTDDFIAMLEDGAGAQLGLDRLSVAVGRIPLLNPSEGDEIIDKLIQYSRNSKKTGWKNRMIVLADDEDSGVHLQQAESMISLFNETDRQQHVIDKIFIDAYQKVGNTYPEARREMFRLLDDGVAWWIFTGHANNHSWTGDGMLTYSDINNMYLRNLPFVLASTCDFLRWDGNEISGGEIMYKERYGGSISMISATRPVYISDNGLFLNAFGRQALSRDDDGQLVRSGEAYRRAKNDIRNNKGNITSNTNRLRFVFMGDPAMAISTPGNIIEVTSINGVAPSDYDRPIISALSNAVIEGRVVSPSGEPLTDFNGVVSVDIYDADYSVTTLAHGDGVEDVYDRHGDKLFSGSTTVTDGVFTLHAPMPSQIAENYREATMSLYAYAQNSNDEAIGLCRDFYVYGFDDTVAPDTEAPVISSFVLNHAGFRSGDVVNRSPMVIARIEDNVGINLSVAGVGQQMVLTLDDFTSYTDVASFYTPSVDGSPSGSINYPLENLNEGPHTLRLRVFDTSGNVSVQTIDFNVSDKILPSIFEVYSDANPAHESASFYVRHDRPETIMDVTITVYNLLGQPIWTGSAKGMSDNDVSAPVTWNLCDSAGSRVQRGIYLYRASITADGEKYESASQRIAVTAP